MRLKIRLHAGVVGLWLIALLSACTAPTPQPTPSPSPTPFQPGPTLPTHPNVTATPAASPTPEVTATPPYPPEGYGPTNFPPNINPLTGLPASDPALLNRRPILIKVQNLPRSDRPQSGLSRADIVYELYTEYGSTRYAALFYGQDAERVMPIRSARYPDVNLIRMYKAVFVFGSAYEPVFRRLANSEFSERLILEGSDTCPALCRYDPNGRNYLAANTQALQALLSKRGIDNTRPNLDGMAFDLTPPTGGQPAERIFARFSGAIYNRWDYDPTTGRYQRFVDKENDIDQRNEVYEPLTDALTKQPITADNVVILLVRYEEVDPRPDVEVLDFKLMGIGPAYLARDGQIYKVNWQRLREEDVLTLVDDAGHPVPFKPGQTWFEVMGLSTRVQNDGNTWRFTFGRDW